MTEVTKGKLAQMLTGALAGAAAFGCRREEEVLPEEALAADVAFGARACGWDGNGGIGEAVEAGEATRQGSCE